MRHKYSSWIAQKEKSHNVKNDTTTLHLFCFVVNGNFQFIFLPEKDTYHAWNNRWYSSNPSQFPEQYIIPHEELSLALFQYPIKRLIGRFREVLKQWYLYLELSNRSEIWQTPWWRCCWGAYQLLKQCNNWKYQSGVIETSRDLTMRHLVGYSKTV